MGGAILDGWRAGGMDLAQWTVIRPSGTPVEGTRTVTTFADAALRRSWSCSHSSRRSSTRSRPGCAPADAKTVVVSLLAGVEAASLRQRFPGVGAIVRAMPNLPVAVRRGVTACTARMPTRGRKQLNNLFSALGFAMWMIDEAKLAALGAVAGAGPAYVARFVAALGKAGEKRGLSEEIAAIIALETVLGTAWMGATTGESMSSIAKRVASPNGTTEAGLAVLDRDEVLDELIAVTIEAAARRGVELAEEARDPLRLPSLRACPRRVAGP